MSSLDELFQSYCGGRTDIDCRGFVKLCRDGGLTSESGTNMSDAQAEQIFQRVMPVSKRRVDLTRLRRALRIIAVQIHHSEEEVQQCLLQHCALCSNDRSSSPCETRPHRHHHHHRRKADRSKSPHSPERKVDRSSSPHNYKERGRKDSSPSSAFPRKDSSPAERFQRCNSQQPGRKDSGGSFQRDTSQPLERSSGSHHRGRSQQRPMRNNSIPDLSSGQSPAASRLAQLPARRALSSLKPFPAMTAKGLPQLPADFMLVGEPLSRKEKECIASSASSSATDLGKKDKKLEKSSSSTELCRKERECLALELLLSGGSSPIGSPPLSLERPGFGKAGELQSREEREGYLNQIASATNSNTPLFHSKPLFPPRRAPAPAFSPHTRPLPIFDTPQPQSRKEAECLASSSSSDRRLSAPPRVETNNAGSSSSAKWQPDPYPRSPTWRPPKDPVEWDSPGSLASVEEAQVNPAQPLETIPASPLEADCKIPYRGILHSGPDEGPPPCLDTANPAASNEQGQSIASSNKWVPEGFAKSPRWRRVSKDAVQSKDGVQSKDDAQVEALPSPNNVKCLDSSTAAVSIEEEDKEDPVPTGPAKWCYKDMYQRQRPDTAPTTASVEDADTSSRPGSMSTSSSQWRPEPYPQSPSWGGAKRDARADRPDTAPTPASGEEGQPSTRVLFAGQASWSSMDGRPQSSPAAHAPTSPRSSSKTGPRKHRISLAAFHKNVAQSGEAPLDSLSRKERECLALQGAAEDGVQSKDDIQVEALSSPKKCLDSSTAAVSIEEEDKEDPVPTGPAKWCYKDMYQRQRPDTAPTTASVEDADTSSRPGSMSTSSSQWRPEPFPQPPRWDGAKRDARADRPGTAPTPASGEEGQPSTRVLFAGQTSWSSMDGRPQSSPAAHAPTSPRSSSKAGPPKHRISLAAFHKNVAQSGEAPLESEARVPQPELLSRKDRECLALQGVAEARQPQMQPLSRKERECSALQGAAEARRARAHARVEAQHALVEAHREKERECLDLQDAPAAGSEVRECLELQGAPQTAHQDVESLSRKERECLELQCAAQTRDSPLDSRRRKANASPSSSSGQWRPDMRSCSPSWSRAVNKHTGRPQSMPAKQPQSEVQSREERDCSAMQSSPAPKAREPQLEPPSPKERECLAMQCSTAPKAKQREPQSEPPQSRKERECLAMQCSASPQDRPASSSTTGKWRPEPFPSSPRWGPQQQPRTSSRCSSRLQASVEQAKELNCSLEVEETSSAHSSEETRPARKMLAHKPSCGPTNSMRRPTPDLHRPTTSPAVMSSEAQPPPSRSASPALSGTSAAMGHVLSMFPTKRPVRPSTSPAVGTGSDEMPFMVPHAPPRIMTSSEMHAKMTAATSGRPSSSGSAPGTSPAMKPALVMFASPKQHPQDETRPSSSSSASGWRPDPFPAHPQWSAKAGPARPRSSPAKPSSASLDEGRTSSSSSDTRCPGDDALLSSSSSASGWRPDPFPVVPQWSAKAAPSRPARPQSSPATPSAAPLDDGRPSSSSSDSKWRPAPFAASPKWAPKASPAKRASAPDMKLEEAACGPKATPSLLEIPKIKIAESIKAKWLVDIFASWCGSQDSLDGKAFVKLCKRSCLLDKKNLTSQDCHVIFSGVVPHYQRRMDLAAFQKALVDIADRKGLQESAVLRMVTWSPVSPASSSEFGGEGSAKSTSPKWGDKEVDARSSASALTDRSSPSKLRRSQPTSASFDCTLLQSSGDQQNTGPQAGLPQSASSSASGTVDVPILAKAKSAIFSSMPITQVIHRRTPIWGVSPPQSRQGLSQSNSCPALLEDLQPVSSGLQMPSRAIFASMPLCNLPCTGS